MAETARPRLTRGETIAVRAAAWTLAAVLAFFGATKLMATDLQVAAFQAWGYPLWLMYAVGLTEVTASLLLTTPSTAFYGGTLAMGVLAGVLATLVAAGQFAQLPLPLVTAAAAGLVTVLDRPAWLARLAPSTQAPAPEGQA